ncbi:proton-conducting transporter membrane subunit [Rhodopirellula sp. MGV]|uniref:proton-conducting transporter transmembrane domain-containing protein n=1 Tax=Rhodopirellula sp. MGV TaxID=2023130 RepID=UPI000B9754C5|nr:proton-conducting transporter membrane subunit [Rhodopirellula sp. MGV]OYP30423.1 oxidoreductase [Rhodopirellula sp. MGV]PNY34768.1 oxidoreductase [Rhodopirellula baltica]
MLNQCFLILGLMVVVSPAVLLAVLGTASLVGLKISEQTSARLTQTSVITGLTASLTILGLMLGTGERHVPIEVGHWVLIPEESFHFHLKFVFDRLSVPFAILSFVLCGTIGAFTNNYLHRERGYHRFFVLYALFLLGMIVSSLAGTIETLFLGWELVGLSSALLVAYFHDRKNPVRNGQHVWVIYRIADAAFLIAALTLHHLTGAGDFDELMGTGPWPEGHATISQSHALFVGLLLLLAAAGKSALVPFSGWLPRAMEGPTPSSAIFYGALSVHLGAYLLLRVSPLLELSVVLSTAVILIGLSSAVFGAVAARVQTDIKSALAFASLTQVGIIVAEIGFGLRYIALIHIIGHACLRTLQLLRAPTLLHDYNDFENAIGEHLTHEPSFWSRWVPVRIREWVHCLALYRGFMDDLLKAFVVRPMLRLFRWCDGMERRWTNFLSGESDPAEPTKMEKRESLEEFV